MKLFLCRFCLGLSLVLNGLCFAQSTSAPASTPTQAKSQNFGVIVAKRVTGTVHVVDAATHAKTELKNGDRIAAHQTVITANDGVSSVILLFSNGASVQLKHDSQLVIDEFLQEQWNGDLNLNELEEEPSSSQTKLNLLRGEMIGKVAKLKKDKSSFGVQTPVGAAGIRGTVFRIVFRPDPLNPSQFRFTLSTAEGHVDLMQGTVAVPAAAAPATAVTENTEVVVLVDVQVDPVTGSVSITLPPEVQSTTQPISAEATVIIQQATQEVIQAAAEVIVTATPPAANEETKQEEQKQEEEKQEQKQEEPKSEEPKTEEPKQTEEPTQQQQQSQDQQQSPDQQPPLPPVVTPPPADTTAGQGQ